MCRAIRDEKEDSTVRTVRCSSRLCSCIETRAWAYVTSSVETDSHHDDCGVLFWKEKENEQSRVLKNTFHQLCLSETRERINPWPTCWLPFVSSSQRTAPLRLESGDDHTYRPQQSTMVSSFNCSDSQVLQLLLRILPLDEFQSQEYLRSSTYGVKYRRM